MRDAEVEAHDGEVEEAAEMPCFNVHDWLETYLAQEHEEIADELVGVPLN